jgi:Family of unknown function (DUF6221)
MSDLTDFLLARLAEDEAVASATLANFGLARDLKGPMLAHVTHFDPARILAECEAKRRIVGLKAQPSDPYTPGGYVTDEILLALAQVYADHPDYRKEWRL